MRGLATNNQLGKRDSVKCTCEQPGHCPAHRFSVTRNLLRICQSSEAGFQKLADVAQLRADPQESDVSRLHVRETEGPFRRGCIHRGEAIDEGTADRCGRKGEKFPIYACALHGECVIGAFCKRQKWKSCLQCEDQSDVIAVQADP